MWQDLSRDVRGVRAGMKCWGSVGGGWYVILGGPNEFFIIFFSCHFLEIYFIFRIILRHNRHASACHGVSTCVHAYPRYTKSLKGMPTDAITFFIEKKHVTSSLER